MSDDFLVQDDSQPGQLIKPEPTPGSVFSFSGRGRDGEPGPQGETGAPGAKGDKGDKGDPGDFRTYTHVQPLAALTWTINHDLNSYPSVVVLDTDAPPRQIYGDVAYVDANQITVTFSVPVAGKALLN